MEIQQSPEARAALEAYLQNYHPGSGPFVISDAIDAVRRTVSEDVLSNNNLLKMISAAGVAARLNIEFNVKSQRREEEALDEWGSEGGSPS